MFLFTQNVLMQIGSMYWFMFLFYSESSNANWSHVLADHMGSFFIISVLLAYYWNIPLVPLFSKHVNESYLKVLNLDFGIGIGP